CSSGLSLLDKMEAHRLGVCVPCKYFAWKVDGCRQGDNCSRCHFCTVDGAKSRKRQLRAEARQLKATAEAGTQCGNDQVEVQKAWFDKSNQALPNMDCGMFLSAADMGLQFRPSVKVQLTFAHCPDVNEASKGLPRRASAPPPEDAITSEVVASVPGQECPEQDSCLSDLPPTDKMEAHRLGVCMPCSYFARKVDGCRQGDNCDRCHLCSVVGVKSRKRQLRAEARQFKAATYAGTQRGNDQVEVQKDFGMPRSAADTPFLILCQ
ncbi:unnamed protein product, partial [Polarella glacialis]